MSVGSLLRSSYLQYFSQPAHERTIFQLLQGRAVRSIVEIGLDVGVRTPRVLEAVGWHTPRAEVRYTGIDQFDTRAKELPRLLLKQAHAELRGQVGVVRLVPGDPAAALSRVANSLAGTDLLLISSVVDRESLAAAWTWVPRMLSGRCLVLLEQIEPRNSKPAWRELLIGEIQSLATAASKARRRAA